MTYTKNIIQALKEVRDEKGLSFNDILKRMEANGDYLSKSTLSRVFAEGSEDLSFKYEETIRPIAKALLDIETIEEDDTMDTQAMKSLLKYKIQLIEDLEKKVASLESTLNEEKIKYLEKLDQERKTREQEREQYIRSIDFLKNQIELKDKRMDQLLEAVFQKDSKHNELLNLILSCPARKNNDSNCE